MAAAKDGSGRFYIARDQTALSGGHAWLDRAGRGEDETFDLVTLAACPTARSAS